MNVNEGFRVKRLRVGSMVSVPETDAVDGGTSSKRSSPGERTSPKHDPQLTCNDNAATSSRRTHSDFNLSNNSLESPSAGDIAFCLSITPDGFDESWIENGHQTAALYVEEGLDTQSSRWNRQVTETKLTPNYSGSPSVTNTRDSENYQRPLASSKELDGHESSSKTKFNSFCDFPLLQDVIVSDGKLTKMLTGNAKKAGIPQSERSTLQVTRSSPESYSSIGTPIREAPETEDASHSRTSTTWANVLKSSTDTPLVKNELNLNMPIDKDTLLSEENAEPNFRNSCVDIQMSQENRISKKVSEPTNMISASFSTFVTQFLGTFQKRQISNIVEDLKLALARRYINQGKLLLEEEDFVVLFDELPLSSVFNLYSESRDGTIRKILTDDELFRNCLKADSANVVTFSQPNFGKTTFCTWLAFNWADSSYLSSKFTLCVFAHVSELNLQAGVPDAFLEFLSGILKHRYQAVDVYSALMSIAPSVLFILDGYDELSQPRKYQIDRFLVERTVFRESTVLVTSRPVTSGSFKAKFARVLFLGGFSYNHLLSMLNQSNYVSKPRISAFVKRFGQDHRMLFLEELPPSFSTCVHQLAVNYHYFQEDSSVVMALLGGVKCHLEKKYVLGSGSSETLFFKLGRFMFEALVRRYTYFTEDVLRQTFSDQFNLLKKCHIFYQVRGDSNNVWKMCSKVLMVYYATFYLRCRWDRLKNLQDRQWFLEKVFCLEDSLGRYVVGDKNVYYVGIVPEIILVLNGDASLKKARFEMYHDTERVEHCQAFNSTNLLVRFGEQHLPRFGFQELEADDPILELFQEVECLCFSELCVDYKLYINDHEGTHFLSVNLTDINDQVVLRYVRGIGESRLLDKAHVEFHFSVLNSVSSLLSKMLSYSFEGFEFGDDLVQADYSVFVWCLVSCITKNNPQSSATIACYDYEAENTEVVAKYLSFTIFERSGEDTKVEMNCTCWYPEFLSRVRVYEKDAFSNEVQNVIEFLQDWMETTKKPGISISIF